MRALLLLVGLAVPAGVAAQGTQENLEGAIDLYKQLQIERARDMFLQVTSTNSPFEVSTRQRVTAYLYLGAIYATVGSDSSSIYYLAALERDPFADLDPQTFTAEERQAFADAKRRSFRVGIRPLAADTVDPRTGRVEISIVSTHEGTLILEVNSLLDPLRFPVFQGVSDGLRQVSWGGTLPDGSLIPPGAYEMIATGQSRVNPQRSDSVRVLFDVEHDFPALEDTLRMLVADSLLPERYPSGFALRDLALGVGVAASAVAIPTIFGSGDLGENRAQAGVVAGVGVLAGIVSFAVRNSNPAIPENIAENARRQAVREAANLAIMDRNQQRLARTRIVIIPTVGALR